MCVTCCGVRWFVCIYIFTESGWVYGDLLLFSVCFIYFPTFAQIFFACSGYTFFPLCSRARVKVYIHRLFHFFPVFRFSFFTRTRVFSSRCWERVQSRKLKRQASRRSSVCRLSLTNPTMWLTPEGEYREIWMMHFVCRCSKDLWNILVCLLSVGIGTYVACFEIRCNHWDASVVRYSRHAHTVAVALYLMTMSLN